jgi:hypothetical protein
MFSKPELQLSDAQLLTEVQRLIAAMPPREAFVAQMPEAVVWTGEALNAEFIERYMPFVTKGARVRLLVRQPDATLLAAAGPAAVQYGLAIEVHAHNQVHDRYAFVDSAFCYHSGASFAEGGKTSPTLVAPIVDYAELLAKYEAMWNAGRVLR